MSDTFGVWKRATPTATPITAGKDNSNSAFESLPVAVNIVEANASPSPCFRIHAADVVRALYCILTQGGVLGAVWPEATEVALLTALLSAAMHDYEHKGFNVRSCEPSQCPSPILSSCDNIGPLLCSHLSSATQSVQNDYLIKTNDPLAVSWRMSCFSHCLHLSLSCSLA